MSIEAWHFLPDNRKLQFEPHTFVVPGETLKCSGPLILCKKGFHASERILDALKYAYGNILCRVVLDGEIIHGDDKLVATERTVLWMANAEEMLRQFAQLQALYISRLQNCPDIVLKHLRTESELIRAASRAATQDAAWAATRAAAWDAAWGAPRAATLNACFNDTNQQLERMAWMLCGPETAQFPIN